MQKELPTLRAVTWTEGPVEQAMIFGVLREYNLVPTSTEGVLEQSKMYLHRASRDWGQLLRAPTAIKLGNWI